MNRLPKILTGMLGSIIGGYGRGVQYQDELTRQNMLDMMRKQQYESQEDYRNQMLDIRRGESVWNKWWPIMQAAQEEARKQPEMPKLTKENIAAILYGKGDMGALARLYGFAEKTGKEKEPPDLVAKHRGLMREAREDWASDPANYVFDEEGQQKFIKNAKGNLAGLTKPFPEEQTSREIFRTDIEPFAARYGLDTDSLKNLIGIDPVTGAMNLPENLPRTKTGATWEFPGHTREVQAMSQQERNRAVVVKMLIDEFGQEEWDNAPDSLREAAIQKRLSELR